MIGRRLYRRPMSRIEVFEELDRTAARKIGPSVVEAGVPSGMGLPA